MKKREQRRDRTWRKGATRRREHLRIVHPNGVVDCVCGRSVWRFAKRRALECDCRSRRHGNPKLGWGPCADLVHQAVRERIAWRRERHQLLSTWRDDRDFCHHFAITRLRGVL
jgi:hypothetical protein